MVQKESYPFNIFVPNLLNICIDTKDNEEISGRLYHCYSKEPKQFASVMELIREAEKVYDSIGFPQASTKTRHFTEKEQVVVTRPEKVLEHLEVLEHEGEQGTIVLSVRFRQNANWQGEFFEKKTGKADQFQDIVEFLKKIDELIK